MRLIADTNRIMASLIKDSVSRKILQSPHLKFATISFGDKEILKYKKVVIEKAGITEEQFEQVTKIVLKKVEVISDEMVQDKMEEAKNIMDEIDNKDTSFIAASLAIENDGIWSDDKHFEKQDKVKIWKTKDLLDYIKSQ